MEKQEEHRRNTAASTVCVCVCARARLEFVYVCACVHPSQRVYINSTCVDPSRVSVHVLVSLLLNILDIGGGEWAAGEGGASEVGE